MIKFLIRLKCNVNPFVLVTSHRYYHIISAEQYTQMLESCIQSKSLKHGKTIHQHLLRNNNGLLNSFALEKLTRMYVICGRIDYARHVFDKIPDPSVILWNLMIRAYAWNGPFESSIDLYSQMRVYGILPTKFTFPFVLKACSSLIAIEHGEEIHSHVLRLGLDSDVYISTALVDLYAKCGALVQAENVFHKVHCRDIVAWNAMISGFSIHGFYADMLRLVVGMQKAGISPNSSTIVTILPAIAQANVLSNGKVIHGYSIRWGFSNEVMVGTGLLDMYGK